MIAARLVRDAMRLCLLAARRYAPYPKWLGRAFRELDVAVRLGPLLDAVLEALLSSIASDWLTPVLRRSPIGGTDLFTDNTDLLKDAVFRGGVRAVLESRPDRG